MINKTRLTQTLIRHEGLKLKPYKCSAGKLTIGIGRNIEDNGISGEEAYFLLDNDIKRCFDDINKNLPWWSKLNDVRQEALVNMCFNLGINRLLGFKKFLAALEAGDYVTAAQEMLDSKWAVQVGQRATDLADMIQEGD